MELLTVNKNNFQEVISLSLSIPDQEMVNSNLYSLAEAFVNPLMYPRIVAVEGVAVGFIMYEWNEITNYAEIHRVMIDQSKQNRGYAKEALKFVLSELKARGCTEVMIAYSPNNEKAIPLYHALGFVPTGETTVDEGTQKEEILAKVSL